MPAGQVWEPEQSRAQRLCVSLLMHRGVAVLPLGAAPHELGSAAGEQADMHTPSVIVSFARQTRLSVHWASVVQCDHQPVAGCGGKSSPEAELEASAAPPLEASAAAEVPAPLVVASPSPVPSLPPVELLSSSEPPVVVSPVTGASVVKAPVVSSEFPPAHAPPSVSTTPAHSDRIDVIEHTSCPRPFETSVAVRGKHSGSLRCCDWSMSHSAH